MDQYTYRRNKLLLSVLKEIISEKKGLFLFLLAIFTLVIGSTAKILTPLFFKEIIEILYSKGLVKILFATETFAIGVNMPTKTVLFPDVEKYDNNGLRLLRSDEYNQMSGRAGRRGLDKFGSVIILPTMELPSEIILKNMMVGKSPMLSSKFRLSYQFVLKTLYSGTFDVEGFLSKTLIMNENDKRVLFIYFEKEKLENKLNNIVIEDKYFNDIQNYNKIVGKLTDTVFSLKRKEREKMEKEKKIIENNPDVSIIASFKVLPSRIISSFINLSFSICTNQNLFSSIDFGKSRDAIAFSI
jgi:superfamily II RNA helicase